MSLVVNGHARTRVRRPTLLLVAGLLVALSGCSSGPELSTTPGTQQVARERIDLPNRATQRGGESVATEDFDIVTVFWGTNRRSGSPSANSRPTFVAQNAKTLSLGFAHVTIPRVDRERGSIQRPWRIASVQLEREDPKKHFTIGDLKVLDTSSFITTSDAILSRSKRFKDEAFIFIHGYNTGFDDAIYRTAQIAFDLEFDGVPYLFSWPSNGSLTGYLHDKDAADSSRRQLLEFVRLVSDRTQAKRIHLIAHSMGTRLLTEALREVRPSDSTKSLPKIHQIVLAAPDIDVNVFEELADAIKRAGMGVTLYASSNDKALLTSKKAALGRVRAGDVPPEGPIVITGIDTIDISDAGFETLWGLNHTTFAERSLLTDLHVLLKSGTHPPDKRMPIYKRVDRPAGGAYWRYVKN
ncbi:MAG: hypothetical protein B7Y80_19640 [Hyphomicrobium sp. 32-62-53]|nr:MAG: hypothetical protein B7Z29_19840 [Hyphomicrobium sp. 12-62-95]OYX97477.1 MAG: hypothetical protein B7Y80_19640 [Hyphomicrobium sp. 32-62-53]